MGGEEFFKVNSQAHISDRSFPIKRNKLDLKTDNYENCSWCLFLIMVELSLYHIFLHAYPLCNVLCANYLTNWPFESYLGVIMPRGHKDFLDNFMVCDNCKAEQFGKCHHKLLWCSFSFLSLQWTDVVTLGGSFHCQHALDRGFRKWMLNPFPCNNCKVIHVFGVASLVFNVYLCNLYMHCVLKEGFVA